MRKSVKKVRGYLIGIDDLTDLVEGHQEGIPVAILARIELGEAQTQHISQERYLIGGIEQSCRLGVIVVSTAMVPATAVLRKVRESLNPPRTEMPVTVITPSLVLTSHRPPDNPSDSPLSAMMASAPWL